MAPRLGKWPKLNVKVPKVAFPRRKAAAPAEAAAEPQPGVRFVPLEWRPAGGAPPPREAPVEAPPLAPAPEPPAPAETALVEETARPAPEPEPAPGPTVAGQPVESLEGIGPVFGEKLRGEGAATVEDLIAADADHLARRTGISANMLAKWQAMGRLQAVRGIGPQDGELLARAGVTTLEELARWEPGPLAEKLNAFQAGLDTSVEGNTITPVRTEAWIQGARDIVGVPAPAPPPEVAPGPAAREGSAWRFAPFNRAKKETPEAAAPPRRRFAFGRSKSQAIESPPKEASDVKPASRFSLSFGRRKDAPPAEAAPAEAPPAAKEPRRLGFTLGRKKPEKEAPAKQAPAKPPEPAPEPVQVAQHAEPAKAVSITLPVPPTVLPEPPAPEPEPVAAPEPEPLPEPVAPEPFMPPATPTHTVDFDSMHLRVDRILSDRSPYRLARPADMRGVEEQVDGVLGSKAPKRARRSGARRAKK